MICFFGFNQSVKILHKDSGSVIQHSFEKVEDKSQISINQIYFSTPSDFYNQVKNIKNQTGIDDVAFAIDPNAVSSMDGFPEQVGFGDLQILEKYHGQKEIKIGIVNAMSNAIGDHLIGMMAFDYWHKKLSEMLPDTKIIVTFFQLNPYGLQNINQQFADKIDHLYVLPSNMVNLLQQDVYIDLGTILLREGFDTENIMDFFLKSLSINPTSVPDKEKRIRFSVPEDVQRHTEKMFRAIRTKKRPVLLFHHNASAPIRGMDDVHARKLVANIIEKSEYFVICTSGLEYQNERFLDVSIFSYSLNHFASIISQADALLTVDTCSYHFADAFDIPTVVLFSTIEPELRIKYYPFVKSIMCEKKGGKLYGKHKASNDPDELKKDLEYLSLLWDDLDVDEVLKKLEESVKLKEASL